MTGSHHEPTPSDDELDPTGVRELLANLPDPGPMPDDLFARISESLQIEQQRRAGDQASGAGTDGVGAGAGSTGSAGGGSVVSLASERARRRPGRGVLWLGGVAAVAMVATLSVSQLVGDDQPDMGVSAQVPGSKPDTSEGGNDDVAREPSAGDSDPEPAPGEADEGEVANEAPAGSEDTDSAVPTQAEPPPMGMDNNAADLPSGGELTEMLTLTTTDWDAVVAAALATDPQTESLTNDAVADCVGAAPLGADSVEVTGADQLVLTEVTLDGAPARVLVARATGSNTAWVLNEDCSNVLAGPEVLEH